MIPSTTILRFIKKNAFVIIAGISFLSSSYFVQYFFSHSSSPVQVKNTLQKDIRFRSKDFEQLLIDDRLIKSLITNEAVEEDFKRIAEKDYFIFLAEQTSSEPQLRFWNTQVIQPVLALWQHEDGQWFQKLINGYYVVVRKTLQLKGRGEVAALALIPVKWEFYVTTNELNNSFAYLPFIEDYYNVSNLKQPGFAITNVQGKTLFWLTEKVNTPRPLGMVTIILRLLAFLCVLWLLYKISEQMVKTQGFAKAFAVLTISFLTLRVLSYYLPFPFNFRQFELFDPAVYGSGPVLKSLGDLLINIFLLTWLLLFAKQFGNMQKINISNRFVRYILCVILAVAVYAITIMAGGTAKSLVADSQISFDVTNFFSLGIYSFIGFFILGCLSVCTYLLLGYLVSLLKNFTNNNIFLQLIVVVVVCFTHLTVTINSGQVHFHLGLLLWLLVVILLLQWKRQLFSFVPGSGSALFWLLVFALSLTALLLTENNKKEWAARKRMAEKLSLQTDPSAENLLSIALSNFRREFLQGNFYRFNTQGSNQFLKDSLLGEHFSGYLNKFDTEIFTFNREEQSLFNTDSASYNTLNTIYNLQSKDLSSGDWRYFEESFDKFYYIARREVMDPQTFQIKGYLFLVSKPRRYSAEKFYPELFSKTFNLQTDQSPSYAYALYKNGELVNSFNDYPFPVHLTETHIKGSGFHEHKVNGFSELWYHATAERVVAVVKHTDGLLQFITLFAYLFLGFLMMWVLYRVLHFISVERKNKKEFRQLVQLNFRTQVHTTITAISVISFLVIGISTIFFFINRHSRTNKERLSRTIQIMRGEVEQALQQQAIMDDMLKVYDEVAAGELQLKMNRISEIHGVDVNVYDPTGLLRVSSQPYYYNKGLLSRLMQPMAFHKLNYQMLVQTIEDEQVGSRSYMSIYVPVRDEKGTTYAYLNIPYFTSQNELRQEISSFLVTLINLNAFIFLIAGLIAFFVTNRITSSFSFISQKMKEIKLGKANEAIVWNRNDEIGELVEEYNKMVLQLEESAALLAKSEREGAWREMARQVAHEIKNPLTPMKLSIQHLQKAIDNNAVDTKLISQNVAKTLVEQIDYLSNIASDFSNFANIGNAKLERINLLESLQAVVNLFKMDTTIVIQLSNTALHPVFVMGDKTQMNRLFTNLIRNAVEAVPEEKKAIVDVQMTASGEEAVVRITDNGNGIEASVKDKIFYPNFTTKTSGTGLGLAMCKGIVEQMKGDVWFDTESGKGTSFFVKLRQANEQNAS